MNIEEYPALQVIVEKLPGSVWWKSKKFRYLGCNDRILEIVGLVREQFIGKTDHDLWEKNIADKLLETDCQVLETGEAINIEERIIRPDGREFIMLTNKSPYYDRNQKIVGILGISTDITERKWAEEQEKLALIRELEVKKLKAEVEEQLRQAITIFSGNIVSLRTPICIMEMNGRHIKNFMPILIDAYRQAELARLHLKGKISNTLLEHLAYIGEAFIEEARGIHNFINTNLKMLNESVSDKIRPRNLMPCNIDKCIDQTLRRYPFKNYEERKLIHWDRGFNFQFMGNEILMIQILSIIIKNILYSIYKNNSGKILVCAKKSEAFNILRIEGFFESDLFKMKEVANENAHSGQKNDIDLGLTFCKEIMSNFNGDIVHRMEENSIEFILKFPKMPEK